MNRRTFLCGMATVSTVAIVAAVAGRRAKSAQPSVLHTVNITDFQFSPSTLHVRTGDRIRWINNDIVPHTATALDSSWDTGELKPQAVKDLIVSSKQTGDYFCLFHPSMKAKLIIR